MTVIVWRYPELDHLLNSNSGAVGRNMEARATKVMIAAKAQVGVRTGALKMSIHKNFERTALGPKVLVGSPLRYALMHHEGTKPHVIVSKPGRMLKFRGRGGMVYTHITVHPGTRPNRYLTDNLPLALISPPGR